MQREPVAPLPVTLGKGIEAIEDDRARIVEDQGVRELRDTAAGLHRAAGFVPGLCIATRLEQTRPPYGRASAPDWRDGATLSRCFIWRKT